MLVILIQLKGYQFLCSRDFLLPVVVNGHGSTVQVVKLWLLPLGTFSLCRRKFGLSQQDFSTQLTLTIFLKGMFNMDTIMSIRMEEGTQNVPEIYKWVQFSISSRVWRGNVFVTHSFREVDPELTNSIEADGNRCLLHKREIKGKTLSFLK